MNFEALVPLYQCSVVKSTVALTLAMKFGSHVPVTGLPATAGEPTSAPIRDATAVTLDHQAIASATVIFDWMAKSGSLNPSTCDDEFGIPPPHLVVMGFCRHVLLQNIGVKGMPESIRRASG